MSVPSIGGSTTSTLATSRYIMAPAPTVMIQVYEFIEGFPPSGNVPAFRCAEGHANHNLPVIRYPQYFFNSVFFKSAYPACPIAQISSLQRKIGERDGNVHHVPFLSGIGNTGNEIGAVADKTLVRACADQSAFYFRVANKDKLPILPIVGRRG